MKRLPDVARVPQVVQAATCKGRLARVTGQRRHLEMCLHSRGCDVRTGTRKRLYNRCVVQIGLAVIYTVLHHRQIKVGERQSLTAGKCRIPHQIEILCRLRNPSLRREIPCHHKRPLDIHYFRRSSGSTGQFQEFCGRKADLFSKDQSLCQCSAVQPEYKVYRKLGPVSVAKPTDMMV